MHRIWIVIATLAMVVLGAPGIHAQTPDTTTKSISTSLSTGPTIASETIAPRLAFAASASNRDDAFAAARRPFGTSQTLMIVGGATFLAGAIIGDDAGTVMMVAGAGVGLYGLYLYLRSPAGIAGTEGGQKMEKRVPSVGLGYHIPVNP